MRLDELPNEQIEGSWRRARNKMVGKRADAITNEDGFLDITPVVGGTGTANYPSSKKCIGKIEVENEKILFFATTTVADSEIGRIKADGKYYPIIIDAILNFHEDYPIQGTYELRYNGDVLIAWTDRKRNPPRILNIDCIPFGVDGSYAITEDDKAKTLLRLFPNYKTPYISPYKLETKENGGLLSGVYYPIIAYEFADGTITPWSKVYNGVTVYKDFMNGLPTTISGGMGGESTSKSIHLTFSNVDTSFKKLRVGYIYKNNGVTTAYSETSVNILSGNVDVVLTGTNQEELVLEDVLVPNAIYDKVQSLTSVQKRLYLGNVEEFEEFNYQTYANAITLKWVRSETINIDTTGNALKAQVNISNGAFISKGTFQDPTISHYLKSFKSGECYAFYIVLKYKNGKYSKAFHIPGRDAVSGDRDVINPGTGNVFDNFDGSNDVYRYQVYDTHGADAGSPPIRKGYMGFWENENEEYPLDPDNPSNVHPDYANIPGVTSGNRKVRHHVFPDLSGFYSLGSKTTDTFIEGFPGAVLTSRIFGIEVNNVEIPAALFDIIDSWEIHYAKRTNANVRVICNDMFYDVGMGASKYKIRPFDLMATNAALRPTYLKQVQEFNTGAGTNFADALTYSEGLADKFVASYPIIRTVTNLKFSGQNTTVPVTNTGESDCIYLETVEGTIGGGFSGAGGSVYLCDLCIYRRNVYLNFNSQELVSTGGVVVVSAASTTSNWIFYGGDVHINRHSFLRADSGSTVYSLIVESVSNIGLRTEDIALSKFFAPKYTTPTPSYYGYNKDYDCVNTFNQVEIYYPDELCNSNITKGPHKVPYSIVQGSEARSIAWRTFKAGDYYEIIRNKGEIWNLTGGNKILYIHTKRSLFLASIRDSIGGDGGDVYVRSSEIFDRPPTEVVDDLGGIAGTQSQFSCLLCRQGYVFVDKEQGKVFLVPNGTAQLKELSAMGLFNYFKTNSATSSDVDNPYNGIGFITGYDVIYNVLFVTKVDSTGWFTLSFSFDLNQGNGGWVAFHDYKPNLYLYDRKNVQLIDNTGKKLYKHYSSASKGTYFSGTVYESYIEVVFNESADITKRFDSFEWITTVEKLVLPRVLKNKTFSHILIYNDYQCSGVIALFNNTVDWFNRDVRNVEDSWFFNNFEDIVIDETLTIINADGTVNTGNLSNSRSWFEKSKFFSKFAIMRLIEDNVKQENVHLLLVGTNAIKSDR